MFCIYAGIRNNFFTHKTHVVSTEIMHEPLHTRISFHFLLWKSLLTLGTCHRITKLRPLGGDVCCGKNSCKPLACMKHQISYLHFYLYIAYYCILLSFWIGMYWCTVTSLKKEKRAKCVTWQFLTYCFIESTHFPLFGRNLSIKTNASCDQTRLWSIIFLWCIYFATVLFLWPVCSRCLWIFLGQTFWIDATIHVSRRFTDVPGLSSSLFFQMPVGRIPDCSISFRFWGPVPSEKASRPRQPECKCGCRGYGSNRANADSRWK